MPKLPEPTEDEILDIIDRIASRLGPKFKFGYHTIDDMKQQAAIFAWEGIENWDRERPLENFLWIHVRNRLYNFKRNNYGRPELPCVSCPMNAYDPQCLKSSSQCTKFTNLIDCHLYKGWSDRNSSKRNLMHSYSTEYERRGDEGNAAEKFAQKEVVDLLDQEIPVQFREDWIRFINNLKLPKIRRDRLIDTILDILKENGIESEAW